MGREARRRRRRVAAGVVVEEPVGHARADSGGRQGRRGRGGEEVGEFAERRRGPRVQGRVCGQVVRRGELVGSVCCNTYAESVSHARRGGGVDVGCEGKEEKKRQTDLWNAPVRWNSFNKNGAVSSRFSLPVGESIFVYRGPRDDA